MSATGLDVFHKTLRTSWRRQDAAELTCAHLPCEPHSEAAAADMARSRLVNQAWWRESCRPYFGQMERTGRCGKLPSTLRRTRWDGFSPRLSLPVLC